MGQESRHEGLTAEARAIHDALTSLSEKLEGVDSYEHRAEVAPDHPEDARGEAMSEEIDHPMITLEWILDAALLHHAP